MRTLGENTLHSLYTKTWSEPGSACVKKSNCKASMVDHQLQSTHSAELEAVMTAIQFVCIFVY